MPGPSRPLHTPGEEKLPWRAGGGGVLTVYSKAVQCWPEWGSVSLYRMNAGLGGLLRDSIISDGV